MTFKLPSLSLFVALALLGVGTNCGTKATVSPGVKDAGADSGTPNLDGGEEPEEPNPNTPDASACPASGFQSLYRGSFAFGRHYPSAKAAVDSLYGTDGTWKDANPLEYKWNYFADRATAEQPHNPDALKGYATGTHYTTARDQDGHLLGDLNRDGTLDSPNLGKAFFEHNGKGIAGANKGTPFTQFWFDDNLLGKYVANAYGTPVPAGLTEHSDYTRWRILNGDTRAFTPPAQNTAEVAALTGLYALASGDVTAALAKWSAILTLSAHQLEPANQRFVYPGLPNVTDLALFKILSDNLADDSRVPLEKQQELIQHSMSVHSILLSIQERSGTDLLGWRTTASLPDSFITTRSTALGVLALSSGASVTLEPGLKPMSWKTDGRYYRRTHNVLSAVLEGSAPSLKGHLAFGPYWHFSPGKYKVDFLVRAPAPVEKMLTLDVHDAVQSTVLAQRDVLATEFTPGNVWTRVVMDFEVPDRCNKIEFRVQWHGTANLDLGPIRIR